MFSIISKRQQSIKNDLLSGLTVALALVPEAVAFALLAHLHPLTGLYAAFTIGLIASIVGGRPGMISGATGAIAVVIGTLVLQHGEEYLFAAVMMMGLIQITFGILKLGKFIRLVPHPVFLGFVNGLALVILIAQFEHFKIPTADGTHEWISGASLYHYGGFNSTNHVYYSGTTTIHKSYSINTCSNRSRNINCNWTRTRYAYRS